MASEISWNNVIVCIKPYTGIHAEPMGNNRFAIRNHTYGLGDTARRCDVYFKTGHWVRKIDKQTIQAKLINKTYNSKSKDNPQ